MANLYDQLAAAPGRPEKEKQPSAYETLGAVSPAAPAVNQGQPGRPGSVATGPAPAAPSAAPIQAQPVQAQPGQPQPGQAVVIQGQPGQPQPAQGQPVQPGQPGQPQGFVPVQPAPQPAPEKQTEPVYNEKTGQLEQPLSKEQREEYARQEAAAKAKFGTHPWAGDPNAPQPPVLVGKPQFNPFKGKDGWS